LGTTAALRAASPVIASEKNLEGDKNQGGDQTETPQLLLPRQSLFDPIKLPADVIGLLTSSRSLFFSRHTCNLQLNQRNCHVAFALLVPSRHFDSKPSTGPSAENWKLDFILA